MELEYEFEPMGEGKYQVRLQGEFIAYTNHTDSTLIDEYLLSEGFETRLSFLSFCFEQFLKEVTKNE